MMANRPRQNSALDVAPFAHQRFRRVGVRDLLDILGNDRTFIEVRRHLMGGSADHLDPVCVRLMIGLRALEAGQETMMNIYAAARQEVREVV